jgi:hypothetical protein
MAASAPQLPPGSAVLDAERARGIAERLHGMDVDETGRPVLAHVRRVARHVPAEAHSVAWLHEALDLTPITEQELLEAGLTSDELRALRLLRRNDTRSEGTYLAHLDLIVRAKGRSGSLARMVKVADLDDRRLHPRRRPGGWSPPYLRALLFLSAAMQEDRRSPASR